MHVWFTKHKNRIDINTYTERRKNLRERERERAASFLVLVLYTTETIVKYKIDYRHVSASVTNLLR